MSLPEVIRIDDVTSGKIDPTLIYNELDRLKVEINILRSDMSLFLKALVAIPDNQHQQEYFRVTVARLKIVQNSIVEYCIQYNKLLPIINLAQIRLGHEVEILPQQQGTPNLGGSISGTTPTTGSITSPQLGKPKGKRNFSQSKPTVGKVGTSNQPIVL